MNKELDVMNNTDESIMYYNEIARLIIFLIGKFIMIEHDDCCTLIMD